MSEQQTPEAHRELEPDAATGESADESTDKSTDESAARIAELDDKWRRTAAELDNFRKRSARDLERAREQERARGAVRWLPILDNLERALEHASSEPDQIIEGVRAVHRQALAVLEELGFPRRDDAGKPFDPAHHEAVSTVADEALVPGTVASVLRPGYGSDDEILRPAAVVVATRGE
jgi:molecular chaperone GrpE